MEESAHTDLAETAALHTEHDVKVRVAMKRARAVQVRSAVEGLDDYELLLAMGHGAFGDVFLARQVSLERRVAVKLSGVAPAEGSLLARLDHPHILKVHDQRRLGDDLHMIVMELVPGGSLKSLLRESRIVRNSGAGDAFLATLDARLITLGEAVPTDSAARRFLRGASDEEVVVHLMAQVASALAYAHAAGITHCDIKPDNILIDASGNARLADFNVSHSSSAGSTGSHGVGGTLPYMAPETFRAHLERDATAAATPAADVFAFGVTLWELLEEERPFADDSGGLLDDRVRARRTPPPLPDVPARWRRVYALAIECMHPDPACRPSSASVAAQLRHWGHRALTAYFLRPQRGVRAPVFRLPYLGALPIHLTSSLVALLSARFSSNLLAVYPPARADYDGRIVRAVGTLLVIGVVLSTVLIAYIRHERGLGTEVETDRLHERAVRRDAAFRIVEIGTLITFLLWAGTGLVKFLLIRRQFPDAPHLLGAQQFASTTLFGATCCAFTYLIALWFVLDVFYPSILQSTLEVPPSRRWFRDTKRRLRIGLCAAALAPSSAVAVLATFGFDTAIGLAMQLGLGASAVVSAFALVSLSDRVFAVLGDAFPGSVGPSGQPVDSPTAP